MRDVIQAELARKLDARLVHELLEAHAEAMKAFYLGGLRLSEVEGGRFCEAAFRLLELIAFRKFTPLDRKLDTDALIERLRQIPHVDQPASVRLHIPRALRLVYDIRNNRNAAHLGDGIDPNLQDSTLVVSVISWVLAEFLRLYHNVSANQARALVDQIVTRSAPLIQNFEGFLKLLRPGLGVSDHCLALLYQCGIQGATYEELENWVRPPMRRNLKRTLDQMVHVKDLAHFDGARRSGPTRLDSSEGFLRCNPCGS